MGVEGVVGVEGVEDAGMLVDVAGVNILASVPYISHLFLYTLDVLRCFLMLGMFWMLGMFLDVGNVSGCWDVFRCWECF